MQKKKKNGRTVAYSIVNGVGNWRVLETSGDKEHSEVHHAPEVGATNINETVSLSPQPPYFSLAHPSLSDISTTERLSTVAF
ncbi:hypothetical protein C0J52_13001 [Blattella germanica]|nr:hypothetical protein C0J52_13001 [Blattella germanica]